MLKKILVAVDGSAASANAAAVARALAAAMGADVVRLHVETERHLHGLERSDHEPAVSIRDLDKRVGPAAVFVAPLVGKVDVAEAIVDHAVAEEADLIAMGTHGRAGIARMLLGSTAQGVLARSPVPIVLARAETIPTERLGTILVPVDGSPGGALAFRYALGLARGRDVRIVVLDVAIPATPAAAEAYALVPAGRPFDAELDEAAMTSARAYTEQLAGAARAHGYDAVARATWGAVAPSICEVADEDRADLIVMSTHAYRGPVRALLGSVADEVARTARRPVLLMRRREVPSDDEGPVGEDGSEPV